MHMYNTHSQSKIKFLLICLMAHRNSNKRLVIHRMAHKYVSISMYIEMLQKMSVQRWENIT